MSAPRIVCWFSAGAASAVATKLALAQHADAEIVVARIYLPEEDADNDRFANDCAEWFGRSIRVMRSTEYAGAEDVWTRRRYMSGPSGAACTGLLKKAVRFDFEAEWQPTHQVFGYTAEETRRADQMRREMPGLLTPLIFAGLTKADCFAMIQRAGIVLPRSYRLGFDNANCIGCVKAQSPSYWNRTRLHYPEVFARRAALSRELGVRLVKQTSGARGRMFLDELDPADVTGEEPSWDCSIACAIAEQEIAS